MANDIWINLPVKDVTKSKEFFRKLGFSPNPGPGNSDHSASFTIGSKKAVLMLFAEAVFQGFTKNKISDTNTASEVLFSLGAESREEVDGMAEKAEEAGGTIFARPQENQGWMYGCGFADLDGHRWNVLYMDLSKMPNS